MSIHAVFADVLLGRKTSIPDTEITLLKGKGVLGPGVDPSVMGAIATVQGVDGVRLLEIILATDEVAGVHEDDRMNRIDQKFLGTPLTDAEARFVRVYLEAVWTSAVTSVPVMVVDRGSRFTAPPMSPDAGRAGETEPPRPPEPRVPRSTVPEAEPPRPRESEEPEEERIPEIIEIYLRSIEHAYPRLKVARTRDEWPEMRAEIERIEREESLLRFSFGVRDWAAKRSEHKDIVDAADAYVTTLLGGFSHPSFAPAAYKSAWRLAVGHPYDEP